ncbi:hypothetical protein BDW66DRAFT_129131, partial [Aspergillus desertorum]
MAAIWKSRPAGLHRGNPRPTGARIRRRIKGEPRLACTEATPRPTGRSAHSIWSIWQIDGDRWRIYGG